MITNEYALTREMSEAYHLTCKAREVLKGMGETVPGAVVSRWILALVEFIEQNEAKRDAPDASNQESLQSTLHDIQQRLQKIEKQGENNGKALSYAAVASGGRRGTTGDIGKTQTQIDENMLREKRKMKELIVRIEDPKEQEALGRKTTKEIIEAIKIPNSEIAGIRKLPSGDLKIHTKTAQAKQSLQSQPAWIKNVAASATIRKEGYAVIAHGMRMNDVRGPKQMKAIEYLIRENKDLHEDLKINRVAWSTRAIKQNKRYASMHIEVETAEMANRLILVGLADRGEIKTCELFEAGCKLTQCFNCQQYGHIAKFCRNPTTCGYCAGRHESRSCPGNKAPRFLRCGACGEKGHPAWAAECRTRKERKHRTEIARDSARRLYATPPSGREEEKRKERGLGSKSTPSPNAPLQNVEVIITTDNNKDTQRSQTDGTGSTIVEEEEVQETNDEEMTEAMETIRKRKPSTNLAGRPLVARSRSLSPRREDREKPLRGREEWRTTRMMNPEIREMAFAKPVRGRPRIRTPSTNEELLNNHDQL